MDGRGSLLVSPEGFHGLDLFLFPSSLFVRDLANLLETP